MKPTNKLRKSLLLVGMLGTVPIVDKILKYFKEMFS